MGLEVHHENPIRVFGFQHLDNISSLNFLEAELSVHSEEEFGVEAAADAAAEADRIVAQVLLMDEDDARTVHNMNVRMLLHGHTPPRSLRRWPHCNNHTPNAEDAKMNLVDFVDDLRTDDWIPYQVNSVHGFA